MSKTIKPENLAKELTKYLNEYVENIEEDVISETDNITEQAVDELKKTSPRGKSTRKKPYYKGWKRQTNNKNNRYIVKIHNKTNYQLTHLLEFGHATRNGKRTKAIPHIRPLEDKYKKIYEEKITTVIKRRSKK